MQLARFTGAAAFDEHAREFLLAHEAEHCLPLGICATLRTQPEYSRGTPFLATVEQGGQIVAAAVRTPPYNVVLSLVARPELVHVAMAPLVEDLRAVYGDALPGVIGRAAESHAFARRWQRETGRSYRPGTKERLYKLEQVLPPAGIPGRMRRASEADRALLARWYDAFVREALPGEASGIDAEGWALLVLGSPPELRSVFLWEDDAACNPVSLAGYTGPTPHGMRIGPVYTPREHRGHGYARALTAALSQYLLDSGRRFVFLFTDLANPTSNHIYQEIGYQPVCDVDVYEFGPS